MAIIFKMKGRKKWYIKTKDGAGRWKTVPGYRDKAATEHKARELEKRAERIAAGMPVADEQARLRPLTELTDEYLVEMARRGRSEPHRSEQRRLLATLWERCDWPNLKAIRVDGLGRFLAELQQQGRAPRTLNSYRDALYTFLQFCKRQHWLEENPLKDYPKAHSGGERRNPKRALSPDEFRRLLALDLGGRHLIYRTAGLSGLRRSELRKLQRCDLTPTGPCPTWHLRAEITKGKRRDVVPMLPELADALRPLWEATPPAQPLFSPWPRHQTFDKDLRRARIPKKDPEGRIVSFHSLRYFFCTPTGRRMPIQLVRLLMRHRDIRTTCNLYMVLGLTDVGDALLQIPRVWG